MVQLTIELPEELASRLHPVQDRVTEIIELGLRELGAGEYILQNELVDFLAKGPTAEEILTFQPSQSVTARVEELLHKNQDRVLTAAEEAELDRYETLDYLMTLVKARVRRHLPKEL